MNGSLSYLQNSCQVVNNNFHTSTSLSKLGSLSYSTMLTSISFSFSKFSNRLHQKIKWKLPSNLFCQETSKTFQYFEQILSTVKKWLLRRKEKIENVENICLPRFFPSQGGITSWYSLWTDYFFFLFTASKKLFVQS